jgi:hypothetical protein
MSRINYGLLKAALFNKLTESLGKNDEVNNSECVEFFEVVKSDVFLQLENIVYKNLLNKFIPASDESSAVRYIDENINLFKTFTRKDLKTAHAKLEAFAKKVNPNYQPSNAKVLKAIDTLLFESLQFDKNELPDIDALHEAYEIVLANIKQPKEEVQNSKLSNLKLSLRESVLKSAVNKFNEKYAHLNEDDRKLVMVLVNPNNKAKQDLFESLKNETYDKLKKSLESASEAVQEKIRSSMKKIESMQFTEQTSTKDIVNLHQLNSSKFPSTK